VRTEVLGKRERLSAKIAKEHHFLMTHSDLVAPSVERGSLEPANGKG
jgi:hypothetical protein